MKNRGKRKERTEEKKGREGGRERHVNEYP
jgi:hypothetical protein